MSYRISNTPNLGALRAGVGSSPFATQTISSQKTAVNGRLELNSDDAAVTQISKADSTHLNYLPGAGAQLAAIAEGQEGLGVLRDLAAEAKKISSQKGSLRAESLAQAETELSELAAEFNRVVEEGGLSEAGIEAGAASEDVALSSA